MGITATDRAQPAPAPQWLIDACNARARPAATATVASTDPALANRRAADYLVRRAPLAVEGAAGDHTTFAVAAKVRDYGVAEADALELLLDHWNDRCSPPWSPEELARKIANAYRYGQNSPGALDPVNDFPPAEQPARQRGRLYFKLFGEIQPELSRPSMVKGVLDHGAMSVIYGESNTGKSFFALDLAMHVARGEPWRGHKVEGGAVVYVAAEAGGSMERRVEAYRRHHGLDADVPFALVPCPVDLFSGTSDTKALVGICQAVAEQTGQPLRFVVIDTLARAMGGGNENASEDMGKLIRHTDAIREATGAHVALIHHSGKDTAKGARGHSSLRAATDTEIEIDGEKVAQIRKQRDFEGGARWGFDLKSVELGRDADGDVVTSAVLVARDADEMTFEQAVERARGKQQKRALEAIVEAGCNGCKWVANEFATVAAADVSACFAEIYEREEGRSRDEKYLRQALSRALAGLESREIIMVHPETGEVIPCWTG